MWRVEPTSALFSQAARGNDCEAERCLMKVETLVIIIVFLILLVDVMLVRSQPALSQSVCSNTWTIHTAMKGRGGGRLWTFCSSSAQPYRNWSASLTFAPYEAYRGSVIRPWVCAYTNGATFVGHAARWSPCLWVFSAPKPDCVCLWLCWCDFWTRQHRCFSRWTEQTVLSFTKWP